MHMAPGFGEDDQLTCEAHGIEVVCAPSTTAGRFTTQGPDWSRA